MIKLKHQKRLAALYILLIFTFAFALVRLYVISEGSSAHEVLSGQYSRKITLAQRRGFVYDRNGDFLSCSEDGYICLVVPSLCEISKSNIESLSEISYLAYSEIAEKMLRGAPFTINTEKEFCADGIYCYPKYKEETVLAPHIVGYVNADGNGMSGAQLGFDGMLSSMLCGNVTYRYYADASGASLPGIGSTLTDKGYTERSGVVLTLDKSLQSICEDISKKYISMGAVCVSDINTGELLASVSLPDFDTENIALYLDSKNGELLNRCAYGFTPGSIFKTVVAAAALEKNPALYKKEYECNGYIELSDGSILSCHKSSGHGSLTMKEAYAQSCNVYFINLAFDTGAEKILDTAKKMGLGNARTLYGICSYGAGLPSVKEDDNDGFLANIAIGQGALLVSPYEALSVFSCAASGSSYELYAAKEILHLGKSYEQYGSERVAVLKEFTSEKLREMMGECILSGLGKEACPKDSDAGGKTATAQTGQLKDGKEILNSWFCGVYPLSSPKYAICVLSDGNGEGGNPRAVFREICEYLGDKKEEQ